MINRVTSASWNYNGKISSCSGHQRQQDWDLCYIKDWIGCAGRTSTLSNVSSVWLYSFHFPRAKSIFQNHKSSHFFFSVWTAVICISLQCFLKNSEWERKQFVVNAVRSWRGKPHLNQSAQELGFLLLWAWYELNLQIIFLSKTGTFFFFKKELMCLTQCLSRD